MGFEFHFSHCSNRVREAFLKTVNHETFKYAGFVVDKRRLYGERFTKPKEVYEFAVGIVCQQVRALLDNSKIIIDKNGDRAFKNKLKKTLKKQMTDSAGNCTIKKVVMEASHSNELLQLADMVCGALTRSHSSSDDRFRDLIRGKEKFVQRWPS